MAVHKLVLDNFFDEDPFSLIGIHCNLEDYRLAFLLNSNLNLRLKRKDKDLNFKNGASYSVFEWKNEKNQKTWNFVSNICKMNIVAASTQDSLFEDQVRTQTFQLLPEFKKVNYLLKISSDIQLLNENRIVSNIQKIPQVITAYSINNEQLASKGNLIF